MHSFARNLMCNFLCPKGLACRPLPTHNAWDFSPTADWKSTLITQAQYERTARHCNALSPWHQIRSWSIYRNRDDLMHQCFLGWGKDDVG